MPDHTHLLISIQPNVAISDIIRDVKAGATKYINENNWIKAGLHGKKVLEPFRIRNRKLTKLQNI